MINIEIKTEIVKVHLPIKTIIFDKEYFDWFSDNLYLMYNKTFNSKEIIRQKVNIEELNMGHWMCLDSYVQAKYNDTTQKVLDVDFILTGYSKLLKDRFETDF